MKKSKHQNHQFSLEYIINDKTGGANPFAIWESILNVNQDGLKLAILRLPYNVFLRTAYWFAVSTKVKSLAGMRCQVCNMPNQIQVHHRTYDSHGEEHRNLYDLVVLCGDCHGLFHGHKVVEYRPPRMPKGIRVKATHVPKVMPHDPVEVPDGDPIVMTFDLLTRCKTERGGFTNETLRAFGLTAG